MEDKSPDQFSKNAFDDSFWNSLEAAVAQLEACWEREDEVDLESLLANVKQSHQRRALIDLIKLDLEYRWTQGTKILIDKYLNQVPHLRENKEAVAELLKVEWELRKQFGDETTEEELIERFPNLPSHCFAELINETENAACVKEESIVVADELLQSIASSQVFQGPKGEYRALPRGQKLGRYIVLSVLGRGGMGIVYLAKDDKLDRLVAVKLLHPWIFNIDSSQPLLLKEARTAANLKHVSIIPIFDFGNTDDGSQFVVMEYVEGQSLDELIKTGSLSIGQSVKIVSQVAEALEVAHREGILHRDIKPANILVDKDGNARIADFGLAVRQAEQKSGDTSGTVPYMAPEQLNEEQDLVDHRADIWSLGVVLFELLTGKRPFAGTNRVEIAGSIGRGRSANVRTLNPEIASWLEQICAKCLQPDLNIRYQSAKTGRR